MHKEKVLLSVRMNICISKTVRAKAIKLGNSVTD